MAIFCIPEPLPPQGCVVPIDDIHASFTLFGWLPVGNSHNSISPRLVLHAAQLEIKILRTDYYSYKAISQVDYLPSWLLRSSQVLLNLAESGTQFFLYLPSAAVERSVLSFLQAQKIPLSPAARLAMTTRKN
ncbi:MAG: hypothetical protein EOO56_09470 [Hymenobacter sp.]|nr:MAG: hypothetical protein EOO56_09470 [Hymenobacter sp.]